MTKNVWIRLSTVDLCTDIDQGPLADIDTTQYCIESTQQILQRSAWTDQMEYLASAY